MTEEEKIIEEMSKIFYVWKTSPEDRQESWNNLARWHLKELKKAELRASIGEVQSAIQMTLDFKTEGLLVNRLKKLQSELRKLEEDNE